jgi:hypothetical protein
MMTVMTTVVFQKQMGKIHALDRIMGRTNQPTASYTKSMHYTSIDLLSLHLRIHPHANIYFWDILIRPPQLYLANSRR